MPVIVFAGEGIALRKRAVPKQLIQCISVIHLQCRLITFKGFRHFGNDFGDVHYPAFLRSSGSRRVDKPFAKAVNRAHMYSSHSASKTTH